jgi:hypothetical protein
MGIVASANHLPMIGTVVPGAAVAALLEGSAVHANAVGTGMSSVPNNEKKINM